jgi:protein TonB
MEVKKTPKADLERDKGMFILMGLVLALALFFVALEWNSEEDLDYDFPEDVTPYIEEEMDYQPMPQATLPVPPLVVVTPQLPVVIEDFHAVDNAEELKQYEVVSTEQEAVSEEEHIVEATETITTESDTVVIFTEVELMPEFPGGMSALVRFIYNSVKYPQDALTQRIQGRVICSFIINKNGEVSDVKIEKGVHASLDNEAMRVLNLLPEWKAGKINGKSVKVKYILPLDFRLK